MEFTVSKRKKLFSYFSKDSNIEGLKRTSVLGQGNYGTVYLACGLRSKAMCVALKKEALDERESKLINTPFSTNAFKYTQYIDYAASLMLNQLVFQKISPHFVISYNKKFKKRVGICDDTYPYKSLLYNEAITNSQTYTNWASDHHSLEEFDNAYFQIMVALYSMQKYFNMTHLDLHSDNILVRKVKPGGYWKYIINNQIYYVPNLGYVFLLNDFGHVWIPSHFRSWFIRDYYARRKITKAFDIKHLFKSTLDFSTSPSAFKKKIKLIIKDLKNDGEFVSIIENHWGDLFSTKGTLSKHLETYSLDKVFDKSLLHSKLRHIID